MIKSADLEIDPRSRRVTRNGEPVELSSLTYDLLNELVNCSPEIAKPEHLLSTVWKNKVVGVETLTQRVAILRKALDEESQQQKYIESVRGQGYRWLPQLIYGENNKVQEKTTNNFFSPKVMVALFILATISLVAYWFAHSKKIEKEQIQTPSYSLQSSLQERLREAWRYYRKFDAESNAIGIKLFQSVLKEKPENVSALVGLSAAYSQESTKFNGPPADLVKGLELAKKATRLSPQNAEAWWALGFNFDARGHIEEAVIYYQKALKLDPDDKGVKSSLAYLLAIQGDLVGALKMNIEAFSSNTHYRHLQIAQILRLLQFNELAEQWYKRADELNPDSVFAAFGRAEHLFTMGRLVEAKQVVEAAINRGVHRPELPILLAQIEARHQDFNSMKSAFESAIEISQHSLTAQSWLLWGEGISGAETDLDVVTALISKYENIVQQGDTWPNNFVELALLETVRKRQQEAIEYLRQAFSSGYLDIGMLRQSPVFQSLHQNEEFMQLVEAMQQKILAQREQVLSAEWAPENFFNPKMNR
ncbi:winged helix-turn-helix domain-containing protein [Aliikangiella coralliicola]|uniref:Tetratricopeptide repeat protein n=1 Tax=Aliikangiella coralliicola TaxID=2592383 RepID=A0A545U7V2_9GAMM|nr:winged helix-turn-helix domain-containing protein [Aliikangiella coralliicola]TQV85544.1 tetratricopeptide repeat protein [Aliikangiella coralliicola]